MKTKCKIQGFWNIKCYNANGTLAWRQMYPNGITMGGLNDILDVQFRAQSQHTLWYVGLIDNTSFTALAAADTMSSHAGWQELASYSEATRPLWTPNSATGGAISHTDTIDFSINASATVKGTFITSVNTKSGATGILWSTGLMASANAMSNGQTLRTTYSCTITPE